MIQSVNRFLSNLRDDTSSHHPRILEQHLTERAVGLCFSVKRRGLNYAGQAIINDTHMRYYGVSLSHHEICLV